MTETPSLSGRDFNPTENASVDEIKAATDALADVIRRTPASRRRSIALTNLETASMFAVKGLFYDDDDKPRT